MCFQPQCASGDRWIDTHPIPPSNLIATAMGFAMMAAAEWHGELIADFAAKCRWLRESEMVRICRASAANEASLLGDRLDMLAVANSARRSQCQPAFVDDHGPSFPASFGQTVFGFLRSFRGVCGKGRDFQVEGLLNVLGIGRRQSVFGAKDPLSPTCSFIGGVETLHLGGQLVS
jgi:hypothetical protein